MAIVGFFGRFDKRDETEEKIARVKEITRAIATVNEKNTHANIRDSRRMTHLYASFIIIAYVRNFLFIFPQDETERVEESKKAETGRRIQNS